MGSIDTTKMSRRSFLAIGGAAATVAAASFAGCAPAGDRQADATQGADGADGVATYADGRVAASELEGSVAVAEQISDFAE